MVDRAVTRDRVLEILDGVMDPEVPVLTVRELGIVRDVDVAENDAVTVTVTPTYSGCPAIQVIEDDIVAALKIAGINDVTVRTVYAPAWSSDWIPAEARAKLKAYGIAPPEACRPERSEGSAFLVQLMRAPRAVQCPYCESLNTELRSEFGSTACKSVCWCNECRQPFEQFKSI